MLIICALCELEKPDRGRGLCNACWMRASRLNALAAFPRRRWGTAAPRDRAWERERYQKNPRREYFKAHYARRKEQERGLRKPA